MGELTNNFNSLTRYLLGELPPAQRDSLEEQFFTENDLFIQLLEAKERLINSYLSGLLPANDRERFESHFLNLPGHRHEVELALFFRTQLNSESSKKPLADPTQTQDWWPELLKTLRANWWLTASTATVFLVIFLTGVWLTARLFRAQVTPTSVNTTTVTSASLTLELWPGRLRSTVGRSDAVKVAGMRAIELKLVAGTSAFLSYRAKLERIEQEAVTITTSDPLKWEQTATGMKVISWVISTDKLPTGDYQVKLEGNNADASTESIGTYHFKVIEE